LLQQSLRKKVQSEINHCATYSLRQKLHEITACQLKSAHNALLFRFVNVSAITAAKKRQNEKRNVQTVV